MTVQPGQPLQISADDWNRAIKASELVLGNHLDRPTQVPSSFQKRPFTVRVQNTTSQVIPPFFPVCLDSLVRTFEEKEQLEAIDHGLNNNLLFNGDYPDPTRNFGISISSIRPSFLGEVVVIGPVICQVDVSDIAHTHVALTDGNTGDGTLISASNGPIRILHDLTRTGWQVVYGIIGGGGDCDRGPSRAVLIEPKEHFSAREYKQDRSVSGIEIEVSEDGTDWTLLKLIPAFNGLETVEITANDPFRYLRSSLVGTDNSGNRTYAMITNLCLYDTNLSLLEYDFTLPISTKPPIRGSEPLKPFVLDVTTAIKEPEEPEEEPEEPVQVWKIVVDIVPHNDHHILCPGGRNSDGAASPFIFSFDLVSEKWRGREFPVLSRPVFLADCAVVSGKLVIASGQNDDGDLNFIQVLDLPNNKMQPAISTTRDFSGDVNLAGRPIAIDPLNQDRVYFIGGGRNSKWVRESFSATTMTLIFWYDVYSNELERGDGSSYYYNYLGTQRPADPPDFTRLAGLQTSMMRGVYKSISGNYVFHTFGGARLGEYDGSVSASYKIVPTYANENYWVDTIFPAAPHVLNECCVDHYNNTGVTNALTHPSFQGKEYAIISGGRTDMDVLHDEVLFFNMVSRVYERNVIDPLPHPRYNAASCLVKGLVRKGETQAADRLFVIGGRNMEGLVPEVDVFNFWTRKWETDWPGLDSGESESLAGIVTGWGNTIIIGGGGGGLTRQQVQAMIDDNLTVEEL